VDVLAIVLISLPQFEKVDVGKKGRNAVRNEVV
jgi:hypothetical protein